MRDPRYDCLFEPIRLGPVTARNRFYQVPHCSGMGWKRPADARRHAGRQGRRRLGRRVHRVLLVDPPHLRRSAPIPTPGCGTTDDIRDNGLMTEAVHAHGALAGVELWLGIELHREPRYPRAATWRHAAGRRRTSTSIDPGAELAGAWTSPTSPTCGDGIADAARRAVEAGFDIVYVYATHGYLVSEFLQFLSRTDERSDEYGGSARESVSALSHELIDVTREAVAGIAAAVAVRYTADLSRRSGELRRLRRHGRPRPICGI